MVSWIPQHTASRFLASLKTHRRSIRTRRRRRADDIAAAEVLEDRTLLSHGGALGVTDALSFETSGQSLWGPGTDPLAEASFEFITPVVPEALPPATFGSIDLKEVTNPARVLYDTRFGLLKAVLFDDDTIKNGLGERPSDPIGQGIYDTRFEVFVDAIIITTLNRDAAESLARNGLGEPPSATILARDGTAFTVDGALSIGAFGGIEFDTGRVDVQWPTTATLEVLEESVRPGDEFTIHTAETLGSATMSTRGPEINASVGAILDMSADLKLEQFVSGIQTINVGTRFDTGETRQEIFGTTIRTNEIELRAEVFDFEKEIQGKPFIKNITVPAFPSDNPLHSVVGFPFADITLLFPELDTPPNSSFDGETKTITNSQLPVTRSGSGETPIDFAKLDLDLDILSLLKGAPLGIELKAPTPGTFTVEGNILDADLGAFFGIGQTMAFDAATMVDLNFSQPVLIETFPGSGTFATEPVTTRQIRVGEDLKVVHPDDGTLQIEPVYSLANTFTTDSDIMLSPAFTVNFLQLRVAGLIADALGISGDFVVFQDTVAIGDPIPIDSIADDQFSLQGFETIPGTVLELNQPPEAEDDAATTVEDQPILVDVLANDSDSNGDPLTIVGTTAATNGAVQIDDKGTADPGDDEILYTPNLGFHGTDSFTYTIDDGRGLTDTATVTVDVLNLVDLSGRVFDDLDNDGLFEPLDGETGIGGVIVRLFDQNDGTLIATEITESDGTYFFDVNLGEGTYKIVETQAAGFLDGDETAGSTDGGATANGIANAALPADGDEITDINVGEPGTTGDGDGYIFAEIRPSSLQGLVWEDFDNDGDMDLGEFAVAEAAIGLSGTDDRGNAVTRLQNTDGQGVFQFVNLRPGIYAVAAAQPDGFVDGKDVVGEVNGVLTGDNDGGNPALSTTNDRFTNVALAAPGSVGLNYRFGERVDGGSFSSGQTAGIGFWQNRNGQALITSLNGSPDSTLLARYLSDTFPHMYGMMGDANGDGIADDPMTNVEVASLYSDLFRRHAGTAPGGPPKLDAQVLATALATYVTKISLVQLRFDAASSTGFAFTDFNGNGVYDLGEEELDDTLDDFAQSLGFTITAGGVGSTSFNVGEEGEAFGVEDDSNVRIIDLLLATDRMSRHGLLYDLDGDGILRMDELTLRMMANAIYSEINEEGDD